MPLHSVKATYSFMVTALSGIAALGSLPSGIAPEFNQIQLPAICHLGKMAGVWIYWQDAACLVVIPSSNVAPVQLYQYEIIKVVKQQAASLEAP